MSVAPRPARRGAAAKEEPMNRLHARAGLVALSVGLGGCFVAAPVAEPSYGYAYDDAPPAVVVERPYYAAPGPRAGFVVENDRVIRHSRPYYDRDERSVRDDHHRRWRKDDRRRHDHDHDDD